MPLTESSKKYFFGNSEPQKLRDWSGPNGQLLYEGYAVQGMPQDSSGWVLYKHFFDGSSNDTGDMMLSGKSWALRAVYTF